MRIGVGMGAYAHVGPAGDSSLDGVADLVAVDFAGNVWVLPISADTNHAIGRPMLIDPGREGERVFGIGSWIDGSRNDFVAINDAFCFWLCWG